MASWEDIKDGESLKAWLDGQPREVAVAIAARAALRVMPVWADFCETDAATDRELTPLPVLRCCLISSVAAVQRTDEIMAAASVAIEAASGVAAVSAITTAELYAAHAADAATLATQVATPRGSASEAAAASEVAAKAANATYTESIWEAARDDARAVENGAPIPAGPPWHGYNPLQHLWDATRARWSEPGSPYAFWRRWYDSLLGSDRAFLGVNTYAGEFAPGPAPMNPDLLYRIALIPDETWDAGPEAVAEAIREIEAAFDAGEEDVERSIAALPPSAPERVRATKQAMERHRADLPPTFDAILGYISLEVKRLQERNYRDDDDEEEAKRQIRTLATLYRAVEQLQSLVPKTDEMPIEDAEKAEKLARLYLNKFKDWPRGHVDDVVGGVYAMGGEIAGNTIRMGLVAATAYALPMIGVPTPWALGAGIAVFGNKTIAEAAKTVRDSVFPSTQ